GTMSYDAKRFISKKTFLASMIFSGNAPVYQGEDYIKGKIGEINFELCELNVKDYSKVRNRMVSIFGGIFMHATFNDKKMKGSVVIIPDDRRVRLSRSIKAFNRKGGREILDGTLNRNFELQFDSFVDKNARIHLLLSSEMQDAMLNYHNKTGKYVYISFIKNEIYIAVSQEKDILEPYIFRSNLSYDLIREFYDDIDLLISIVEDFDKNH
ncbi:MAG TPA: DUF3137 domain-containing protein, partial [Bacteroidetes bacterium]|nr:DUF3137 domain-containing protein [Bacteroidota bacterium]